MTHDVTRRNFLKSAGSAAVVAGVAASGVALGTGTADAAKIPKKWDKKTDVVVVGAGGGGLAAAIEAIDAGLKVIILEKTEDYGGSTRKSSGIVYAAGTSVQKANGISDTPDEMVKYWTVVAGGWTSAEHVRVLADNSAANIEWLLAMKGCPKFILSYSGREKAYDKVAPARPRGHVPEGLGKALMETIYNHLTAKGGQITYKTPAMRLIANTDGEVIGVKAATPDGKDLFIRASRAVILATGGFSWDFEMVKQFIPNAYAGVTEVKPYPHPGGAGDGIKMGQELGANLKCMTGLADLPALSSAAGLAFHFSGEPRGICAVVNLSGKRFAEEGAYYEDFAEQLVQQKGGKAFAIFDDKTVEAVSRGFASRGFCSLKFVDEIKAGVVFQAITLKELAAKAGLDAAALEETIKKYNSYVASGVDAELNKSKDYMKFAIASPPFYAAKVLPGWAKTMGGLQTNIKAQVINSFGEVIPRLYATGEVTGWMGLIYAGSGTAIADTIGFGRIAARTAAKEKPLRAV